jgi:hypothetical protein
MLEVLEGLEHECLRKAGATAEEAGDQRPWRHWSVFHKLLRHLLAEYAERFLKYRSSS